MGAKQYTYHIHRNALIWLLSAHFFSVFPHFFRTPIWLVSIVLSCIAIRIMIYRGRWDYPNRAVKFVLVVIGVVAIYANYGAVMGPDAGVALLILTYSLKLLEMQKKKDAYIIVLLTYFVIATNFLFNTSFLLTIYLFLVSILVTAALLGMNQSNQQKNIKRGVKLSTLLLLQSAPLMVFLFTFFPRIPPFWVLEFQSGAGKLGLSDSMTPADVAKMGGSAQLAFRANFKEFTPRSQDLYWRAMVFSKFDGRSWKVGKKVLPGDKYSAYWYGQTAPQWINNVEYQGRPVRYTVIAEITDQPYLPVLDLPKLVESETGLTPDFRMLKTAPINAIFKYEALSYMKYRLNPFLTDRMYKENVALPEFGNSKSREFALSLFQKSNKDPEQYIINVLSHFHNEEYSYTLKPPRLSDDIVDRFLFDTRLGFCAHYAGAFVYLMRAVGIPARVVAGYHGGEINPIGNYVLVHQFDAHAWSEVWLPSKGWVRYDPTAHVAPERILDGVQDLIQNDESLGNEDVVNAVRIRQLPLINEARMAFDYMNYSWDRFVVGYNSDAQEGLMQKYFNGVLPWELVVAVLSFSLACVIILALVLFKLQPGKDIDEVERAFSLFCIRLSRRGVERRIGETPNQLAGRVKLEQPALYDSVVGVADLFYQYQYARDGQKKGGGLSKRQLVRRIKIQAL